MRAEKEAEKAKHPTEEAGEAYEAPGEQMGSDLKLEEGAPKSML